MRAGAGRGARWPDQPAPRSLLLLLPPPPPAAIAGLCAPEGARGGPGGMSCHGHRGCTESAGQRPGWRAAAASEAPAPLLLREEAALLTRAPHGARKAGNPRGGDRVRSARAKLTAPPWHLLPPLPALRSPLLAGPTPPSSDSSRVPPSCSPAAVQGERRAGGVRSSEGGERSQGTGPGLSQ